MDNCKTNAEEQFDASSDEAFYLTEHEGWPDARHQYTEESIWAIRAALATGRPLLVRGDPGTGKSQLARAAATTLKRPFLYDVVSSRTEVTDLLYQFDAVARLAEAQILGAAGVKEAKMREKLKSSLFVRPGKVWWATNWETATNQANDSGSFIHELSKDQSWENGCVLLVDEIDKADSELPNALLECFANRTFQVPYLDKPIACHSNQKPPLVVVTTNEERELPAPFLRRCLVLNLDLKEDKDDENVLIDFLVKRGGVQFKNKYGGMKNFDDILKRAAVLLNYDRNQGDANVFYRPGQAEYLDLCNAVFKIASEGKCGSADDILTAVSKFNLKKNVGQQQ